MTGKRIGAAVAAAAFAIAVAAAAVWTAWSFRVAHRTYSGWSGAAVVVEIQPDWSAREVLRRLRAAGVIESAHAARAWLWWTGGDRKLQAGEYRFDQAASLREVMERIQRGDVLLHRITVPEGLHRDEVVALVTAAGFGAATTVQAAFGDVSLVRDIDPDAKDLEGYLFPETYSYPKGETAATIARAMVARFRDATGPQFAERARSAGLTVRQAVTLASLIEEETSLPSERARIASVFHNRLRRGMLLQCDPTVLYALHLAGRDVAALSRADLAFASPWNTYRNVGLPPGPICSPSGASLEAAVAPLVGPDLYFVAAPGGGHRFSADLKSHEAAVRIWRAYVRSSR